MDLQDDVLFGEVMADEIGVHALLSARPRRIWEALEAVAGYEFELILCDVSLRAPDMNRSIADCGARGPTCSIASFFSRHSRATATRASCSSLFPPARSKRSYGRGSRPRVHRSSADAIHAERRDELFEPIPKWSPRRARCSVASAIPSTLAAL